MRSAPVALARASLERGRDRGDGAVRGIARVGERRGVDDAEGEGDGRGDGAERGARAGGEDDGQGAAERTVSARAVGDM